MKTFKQYLLEASNLSDKDKKTINYLISTICNVYDRSDITTWLKTNVYKFIVNKSNHTNSNFFTKEEIVNAKGEKDIRDVFNDVNGLLQNTIYSIVEYLYNTYTTEQASIKYGNNFARLSFVDAEKEYKKSLDKIVEVEGTDYEVIKEYSDGYKLISILTQNSLNKEGKCMAHCTKYKELEYEKQIQDNVMKVLSLRDEYNRPHATLEYRVKGNSILQIKGNGNGPVVSKYIPYIIEYLNEHKFTVIHQLTNINAIKINGKIVDKDNIPLSVFNLDNDIDLSRYKLTKLPQFPKKFYYNFYCPTEELTSLKGVPQYIKGVFNCSENKLETLQYGPVKVDGPFTCSHNKLSSLKYAPTHVGGYFDCSSNPLISLDGIPKYISGNFIYYNGNKKFTEDEVRKLCDVQGEVILTV